MSAARANGEPVDILAERHERRVVSGGEVGIMTSRYSAFISYSHADQAVARWLHRAIETYALPKR